MDVPLRGRRKATLGWFIAFVCVCVCVCVFAFLCLRGCRPQEETLGSRDQTSSMNSQEQACCVAPRGRPPMARSPQGPTW